MAAPVAALARVSRFGIRASPCARNHDRLQLRLIEKQLLSWAITGLKFYTHSVNSFFILLFILFYFQFLVNISSVSEAMSPGTVEQQMQGTDVVATFKNDDGPKVSLVLNQYRCLIADLCQQFNGGHPGQVIAAVGLHRELIP